MKRIPIIEIIDINGWFPWRFVLLQSVVEISLSFGCSNFSQQDVVPECRKQLLPEFSLDVVINLFSTLTIAFLWVRANLLKPVEIAFYCWVKLDANQLQLNQLHHKSLQLPLIIIIIIGRLRVVRVVPECFSPSIILRHTRCYGVVHVGRFYSQLTHFMF